MRVKATCVIPCLSLLKLFMLLSLARYLLSKMLEPRSAYNSSKVKNPRLTREGKRGSFRWVESNTLSGGKNRLTGRRHVAAKFRCDMICPFVF